MSDDISHKVISIFQHHRRGEHGEHGDPNIEEAGELTVSPDGFHYVSIKHDGNDDNEEATLLEIADMKHYLIKIMEVHHDSHTIRLNNYHVPGGRLEEFLRGLSQRPGKILEIKQFIPDNMA